MKRSPSMLVLVVSSATLAAESAQTVDAIRALVTALEAGDDAIARASDEIRSGATLTPTRTP